MIGTTIIICKEEPAESSVRSTQYIICVLKYKKGPIGRENETSKTTDLHNQKITKESAKNSISRQKVHILQHPNIFPLKKQQTLPETRERKKNLQKQQKIINQWMYTLISIT